MRNITSLAFFVACYFLLAPSLVSIQERPGSTCTFETRNILKSNGITNETLFSDDFEGNLDNWYETSGLWHLTSNASAWPNRYHSPTHAMWFGNETTGNYMSLPTETRESGNLTTIPIDLSRATRAFIEFHHWRGGENTETFDISFVRASNGSGAWTEIYREYLDVTPWELVSLNITGFCGNDTIQIAFVFDTMDAESNDFDGWLVDDVRVSGITVPVAPVITAATPGDGEATLAWTAPANEGASPVSGYSLYWSVDNASFTKVPLGNVSSYVHQGLNNSIPYYYKVAAINAIGEGTESAVVTATPVAPSIPAVQGYQALVMLPVAAITFVFVIVKRCIHAVR